MARGQWAVARQWLNKNRSITSQKKKKKASFTYHEESDGGAAIVAGVKALAIKDVSAIRRQAGRCWTLDLWDQVPRQGKAEYPASGDDYQPQPTSAVTNCGRRAPTASSNIEHGTWGLEHGTRFDARRGCSMQEASGTGFRIGSTVASTPYQLSA